MGRRRKSQDAASGVLLLLVIAVAVAIFVIRLVLTFVFYVAAPVLLIGWVSTFRKSGVTQLGAPEAHDDASIWSRIVSLQAERQKLFSNLRDKYAVGFESGLVVTAKSDNKFFHAGSRLGKQSNYELDRIYADIDSVQTDIRRLRLGVASQIPDWTSSFGETLTKQRLHRVFGVSIIVLFASTLILHSTSLLSPELIDSASKVLLWNPDPVNISGDLVFSCGVTCLTAIVLWPLTGSQNLSQEDAEMFGRWQQLQEKWSQELEYAPFDFEQSFHQDRGSDHVSSTHPPSPSWFEVLNVSQNAPPEDIKRAYRDAIRQYHPDRVSGLGERLRNLAEEESKRINAAFSEAKRSRGFS